MLLFVDPIARPRDTDWKEVGGVFLYNLSEISLHGLV